MADSDAPHRDIAKHLEFLGYTCAPQPDGWCYASHPIRWNFFFRPVEIGVFFHCTIRLGILSDQKRIAWLEFFNRANEASAHARFTLERDEPNDVFVMRIRSLAPGTYRRVQFGAWLDAWHRDLERLRDGPPPETDLEEKPEEKAQATVN